MNTSSPNTSARYPDVVFGDYNTLDQVNDEAYKAKGALSYYFSPTTLTRRQIEVNGRFAKALNAGIQVHGVKLHGRAKELVEKLANGSTALSRREVETLRGPYIDQVVIHFKNRISEIRSDFIGMYFGRVEVDRVLESPRRSELLGEGKVLTNEEFEELNGLMVALEYKVTQIMNGRTKEDIKQERLGAIIKSRRELVSKYEADFSEIGFDAKKLVGEILGARVMEVFEKKEGKYLDEDYALLEKQIPLLKQKLTLARMVKDDVLAFSGAISKTLMSVSLYDFTRGMIELLRTDRVEGKVDKWEESRVAKALADKGYVPESFSPSFRAKFEAWLTAENLTVSDEEIGKVIKAEVDWIAFMRCAWKAEFKGADIAQYDDLSASLFVPRRPADLSYYIGSQEALKKSEDQIKAFLQNYFGEGKDLPSHVFSFDMLRRFWATEQKRAGLENSQKAFSENDRSDLKVECEGINRRHGHYVALINKGFSAYLNLDKYRKGDTQALVDDLSASGYGDLIETDAQSGPFIRFFMPEGCFRFSVNTLEVVGASEDVITDMGRLQGLFDFYFFSSFFLKQSRENKGIDSVVQTVTTTMASGIPTPPPMPEKRLKGTETTVRSVTVPINKNTPPSVDVQTGLMDALKLAVQKTDRGLKKRVEGTVGADRMNNVFRAAAVRSKEKNPIVEAASVARKNSGNETVEDALVRSIAFVRKAAAGSDDES